MSKKIGFTCGTFDIPHAGHSILFEICKNHCDHLIVGLHIDPSVDRVDKNKPIMSLDERYTILRGIKWIDAILVYETDKELVELLEWLPIDIRFVGEDWRLKKVVGNADNLFYLPRSHNHSSTNLRKRIKES